MLKISDGVDKAVTGAAFVCIAGFLIVMFLQVCLRNLAPQYAFSWSDAACRYFFIWGSFLAAARAIKHRRHISITIISDALKGIAKRINVIIIFAIFFTLVVITFRVGLQGIQITSVQKSDALPFTIAIVYAAIPVGAAFSIFQLIVTFIEDNYKLSHPPEPEKDEGVVEKC